MAMSSFEQFMFLVVVAVVAVAALKFFGVIV
jgi:hypothetical protein